MYESKIMLKLFIILMLSSCISKENEIIKKGPKHHQLVEAANNNDTALINTLWADLTEEGLIPYTFGDSVYFFYKGDAGNVAWNGDFNGWGGDRSFKNSGDRLGAIDIWLLKASFNPSSRLDYKIVVDNQWILDPVNKNYQYTGAGGIMPNSELRMPEYEQDSISINLPDNPGITEDNKLINSSALGYTVAYKVHLPYNYKNLSNVPVLFVTDGHEFEHNKLGNLLTITDNLTQQNLIDPVIIVLIDPLDPLNLQHNRRIEELANNPNYANFLTQELYPAIKNNYRISTAREDIALGGVSLGGLNAAYVGQYAPDLFGKLAVLSPAFWFKPAIFDMWSEASAKDFKIFLSVGIYNDGLENAKKFENYLKNQNIAHEFSVIHQGHSWGHWRDISDDMLIYLFGKN